MKAPVQLNGRQHYHAASSSRSWEEEGIQTIDEAIEWLEREAERGEAPTGPILAERVAGEVAVAGDLRPVGNVAQVPAGEPTELVYDMEAESTAATQRGFDAVRFLTPSRSSLSR